MQTSWSASKIDELVVSTGLKANHWDSCMHSFQGVKKLKLICCNGEIFEIVFKNLTRLKSFYCSESTVQTKRKWAKGITRIQRPGNAQVRAPYIGSLNGQLYPFIS